MPESSVLERSPTTGRPELVGKRWWSPRKLLAGVAAAALMAGLGVARASEGRSESTDCARHAGTMLDQARNIFSKQVAEGEVTMLPARFENYTATEHYGPVAINNPLFVTVSAVGGVCTRSFVGSLERAEGGTLAVDHTIPVLIDVITPSAGTTQRVSATSYPIQPIAGTLVSGEGDKILLGDATGMPVTRGPLDEPMELGTAFSLNRSGVVQ